MRKINTIKIDKQFTFDLQAVDSINLYFDSGKGCWGTVEFYQEGMKLEKVFYDGFETIQELVQAINKFLKNGRPPRRGNINLAQTNNGS